MADEDETIPGGEPLAEDPSKKYVDFFLALAKKYDQNFFLALAAQGKEAWNAWRRDPANEYVCVTFAGIDFSQAPRDQINFAGLEFGDNADFSGCKWRGGRLGEILLLHRSAFVQGRACVAGASFGSSAVFTGATFGDGATLTGAAFGGGADFTRAAFGEWADFTDVAFGETGPTSPERPLVRGPISAKPISKV